MNVNNKLIFSYNVAIVSNCKKEKNNFINEITKNDYICPNSITALVHNSQKLMTEDNVSYIIDNIVEKQVNLSFINKYNIFSNDILDDILIFDITENKNGKSNILACDNLMFEMDIVFILFTSSSINNTLFGLIDNINGTVKKSCKIYLVCIEEEQTINERKEQMMITINNIIKIFPDIKKDHSRIIFTDTKMKQTNDMNYSLNECIWKLIYNTYNYLFKIDYYKSNIFKYSDEYEEDIRENRDRGEDNEEMEENEDEENEKDSKQVEILIKKLDNNLTFN